MTLKTTNEDRPDIFGPYFSGMENIHKEILDFIKKSPRVKQETIMVLLQCNYAEYVGEHHDNNYQWKELCFEGDPARTFAVGINTRRLFAEKDNQEQLISTIASAWTRWGFDRPVVVADIKGVAELKKDPWEMILSVHFYLAEEYKDDSISDTQYFKIVYTRTSLSGYMDRIRLT